MHEEEVHDVRDLGLACEGPDAHGGGRGHGERVVGGEELVVC